MTWDTIFQVLGPGGLLVALTGATTWKLTRRKLGADARGALTDAAVKADAQLDSHWEAIVRAQMDAVVAPLRAEVESLRAEVKDLKTEVEHRRDMYWRAIGHTRALTDAAEALYAQVLAAGLVPAVTIPTPPLSIAADI